MDLLRSLPIGLYLEQPITWLHRLDPRVKLGWLVSFLLAPILASAMWKLSLVGLLVIVSILAGIPWRALKQQMGWLLLVGGAIFLVGIFSPDSINVTHQLRSPPDTGLEIVQPYQYVLFKIDAGGLHFKITKKSLDNAIYASSLIFTLVYSTTVYLLTTSPEEITTGLESLMSPLRRYKVPVTEIALTLTLALRFIPLVLEEIQNLVRSIYTRSIDWQKLGIKNSAKVWLTVSEKLLENLLNRAEQIAIAMQVRGFTTPNTHKVEWHQLKLGKADFFAMVFLFIFWAARFIVGRQFV
ncbi:energy-coupling factor transporter transmembrane protein EcfT [Chamaesiphon sp. VAR_48_metabat_135_sub]|uniref:energy-coupling factor transporter transmembrane component T family protein n=1 Tax=Chamaesiphon sp. VAR_48_metabat_135_sub TaxID=2964699 RepID=UPI00286CD15D|nr:energy-coupling factor transporter transmembrane protein EcfT [Chamaesiphon sp. VAR_48_metabat_135_sub]